MTTKAKLAQRLVAFAVLVFTVQAGVTLAAYFNLRLQSLSHVVRVYAASTALADASSAFRVVVLDGASGRRATDAAVEVSGAFELGPLTDMRDAFHVGHFVSDEGYLEWRATVAAESLGARSVALRTHVGDGTDWLNSADTYTQESSARASNHSVGAADGPQIEVSSGEGDRCGYDLSVVANGGVASVGLENELYLRLTRADGTPVSRAAIEVDEAGGSSLEEGVSLTTNSLGVTRLSFVPQGQEEFTLRFACPDGLEPASSDESEGAASEGSADGLDVAPGSESGGAAGSESGGAAEEGADDTGFGVRKVEITPSWDGVVIRPTATSYSPASTFGVMALQQRAQGDWHMDVWCDDAWLSTATARISQGATTLGLVDLQLAAPAGGVRLCLVQGYRYMLSPDPPRSVAWFLVRDEGVTAAGATRALVEAAAVNAPASLASQLTPATIAALVAASPDEVEVFGRWLLNSLPQPFFQWPLMQDDEPAAREEFARHHGNQQSSLLLALAVDAAVLFFSVFGFIIPAARRQRIRLRAAMDDLELDELDGAVHDDRQMGALLLVGACTVLASLLGIGVLLYYLS